MKVWIQLLCCCCCCCRRTIHSPRRPELWQEHPISRRWFVGRLKSRTKGSVIVGLFFITFRLLNGTILCGRQSVRNVLGWIEGRGNVRRVCGDVAVIGNDIMVVVGSFVVVVGSFVVGPPLFGALQEIERTCRGGTRAEEHQPIEDHSPQCSSER